MKLVEITPEEMDKLDMSEKTYFSNGVLFDDETDNVVAFYWYPSPTSKASKYYKVVEE